MVIWIIGKSGAGKTFLSQHLFNKIKKKYKKVIWIDGDKFRKKFSKDLGYSLKDRRKNSARIQKYCKKFDVKNYIVICSILSIFREHQKKNRKIYSNYLQIYLKVNFKLLELRNNNKIYSRSKQVVGRDIYFPKPFKSDLIIKNTFNKSFLNNLKKITNNIYERI
tara:strand:- start:39 stop:533 length:495 start_codon:yes stop_codon:yes gene_type:complete